MKMVSRLFCLSLFLAVASAATWMGRLPHKPEELAHKEGCYVEEINDVIPFGDTVTPTGICYRIECSRTAMYYASCGSIGTDLKNCFVTKLNLNRPYPECCPTIKCEEDNKLY